MPVIDAANDDVFYQEVDVVLTAQALLTVRKTTPGRPPYDSAASRAGIRSGDTVGRYFYRLVDDIADRYLDLVDGFEDEIGELEDGVESGRQNRFVRGCARSASRSCMCAGCSRRCATR